MVQVVKEAQRLLVSAVALAVLAVAAGACQWDQAADDASVAAGEQAATQDAEDPQTAQSDAVATQGTKSDEVAEDAAAEAAVMTVVPTSAPPSGADAADAEPEAGELVPDAAEIVFVSDVGSGYVLSTVAADGSGQRQIGSLDAWPSWLSPHGSEVAFLRSADDGGEELIVMDVDGSNQRLLAVLGDDVGPVWAPDGNWLAYSDWVEDSSSDSDLEVFVVAADGESAAQQVTRNSGLDDIVGSWWFGSWSPDSARIAFMGDLRPSGTEGVAQDFVKIYVTDVSGTSERQLVADIDSQDGLPAWSPDGAKIAYFSFRDDAVSLWVIGADGSGAQELIADYQGEPQLPVWSPDSTRLAIYDSVNDRTAVSVVNADGSGLLILAERIVNFWRAPLVWSPDGSQIAFSDSGDSENDSEIFVVGADGGNLRQLTDNDVEDHVLAWS